MLTNRTDNYSNGTLKIAVIGSGLAGISASWFLSRCGHTVHLYEKHELLGLGAHSVEVGSVGDVIDVPARTFVAGYYPEMIALCKEAGVRTNRVVAEPTFQVFGEGSYFGFQNFLVGAYALPFLKLTNTFKTWRTAFTILYDMWKFKGEALKMMSSETLKEKYLSIKVQDYLDQNGYSKEFGNNFLLPLFGVVATCSIQAVQNYPVAVVMEFLSKVLLTGKTYSKFTDGCRKVSEDLVKDVDAVYKNTSVEYVQSLTDHHGNVTGVAVKVTDSKSRIYDHVIISTQANQALRILGNASDQQSKALSGFEYEYNECIVHTDPKLMPKNRKDWSPLSIYIKPDDYNGDLNSRNSNVKVKKDTIMFTMWQNTVQQFGDYNFLPKAMQAERLKYADLFQTWNPWIQPNPASVVPGGKKQLERSIVTTSTPTYWKMIQEVQGQNNIWFCGAYSLPGVPLLENATNSGLLVAEKLTGKVRPWRIATSAEDRKKRIPLRYGTFTNFLFAFILFAIAYVITFCLM